MSSPEVELVEAISGNKATDHCEVVTTHAHGLKTLKCKYCDHNVKGTGTCCYVHLTGEGCDVARCNSAPSAVVTALKAARAAKLAESSKKRKAEEDVEQRRLERSASLQVGAAGWCCCSLLPGHYHIYYRCYQ
jgi:hypothetical protein